MRRAFTILAAPLAVLAVTACSDPAPEAEDDGTTIPESVQSAAPPVVPVGEEIEIIGTPMAERTATLGLLNKRNNLSQDIELKPGESRRIGDVIVRLAACERTQPYETPKETGAFVQLLVRSAANDDQWGKVFSGWLFKNSPSLNVVEHPIYDVWVKDCAMSFPGESAPAPSNDSSDSGSE